MRHYLAYGKHLADNIKTFLKWIVIGTVTGLVVGMVGTSFYKILAVVGSLRNDNKWLLYFLPLGGLVIAFLYRYWMKEPDKGTNLVLSAIASEQEITPKLGPLIYIATVITQLFGGSAGREGAALQIGGCIGNVLGRWMKLDESDKHTIIMCGMSAGFSALFGTPLASAIFAMEVISVGVMYYGALVPCVIAAYVSVSVAGWFGIKPVHFAIGKVPQATLFPVFKVFLIACACAIVSGMFCYLLHLVGKLYRTHVQNPFARILLGGFLVNLLVWVMGTRAYIGDGMPVILHCFDGTTGQVSWVAFLMKMLFTAITLGAGFKGGEIVPSLFVGATFGYTAAAVLGLPPAFAAAIGMVGVFCGVTNCPITSLILALEMFGYHGTVYMALVVAISYMLSGYYGLYDSQKIMYSKMKTSYINRKINNRVH